MNDLSFNVWEQLIHNHDGLQVNELQSKLEIEARSTLHSALKLLIDAEMAEQRGTGRETYYVALVPKEWELLADKIKRLAIERRYEAIETLIESGE